MHTVIYKIFLLTISSIIMISLSGCHSKNIYIKTTYSKRFAWNKDNSAFAFVAINKIYRSPVGIAKFPDGGKTITVYSDASVYYYDIKQKQLHRVNSLNNLNKKYHSIDNSLNMYPTDSDNLFTYLLFDNSLIYYKLRDATKLDRERATKYLYNHQDLSTTLQILDDASKIYVYNIHTKKTSTLNSLPKNLQWTKFNYDYLKDLRKAILNNISYSEWGVILKDIYPQSKDEYIDYIIKKSTNKNTMRAIHEQFVPTLTQEDKKYILQEMDNYSKELYNEYKNNDDGVYQESLKKARYENYLEYMKITKKRFLL